MLLTYKQKGLIVSYKALCKILSTNNEGTSPGRNCETGICDKHNFHFNEMYLSIFPDSTGYLENNLDLFVKKLALELETEQSYPVPAPKWFYESAKVYYNSNIILPTDKIPEGDQVFIVYEDKNGSISNRQINTYKDTYNNLLEHAAYYMLPKWTGDYGALRLEFLSKLIEMHKEELLSNGLEEYI
ncbi:hypothetical protein TH1_132 [Shewanella phage Thanatos-1]|nr:hypothetical protein TH1_132 [Shewanella phage Thanatos-1]